MASLRVVVRVPRRDSPSPSPEEATSGADDDLSDGPRHHAPPQLTKPAKKRKSSYHARKATVSALLAQEQTLRRQLRQIKAVSYGRPGSVLQRALRENDTLRTHVGVNRLEIAGVQSFTSSLKLETSPLADYIHLPCGARERRQLLCDLKARKLDEAVRYLLARAQSQNLRRRAHQVETFQTEDGDHVALDWGVVTFEQPGLTVKTVYDEVIEFARTHEMVLADKLGLVTIRESEIYPASADVAEVRMLLARDPDLLIEKNMTFFTQYFQRSDQLNQPHGVLVSDYVDRDDLYPYQSDSRVRKDFSAATMVVQCPPRTAATGELPAIAILNWSHCRIHKSPLATEDQLESMARESFFDVMVHNIRERLSWKASEQLDLTHQG